MKKCEKCWGTGREPDQELLGYRARRAREARKESLTEAARDLGISAGFLSYLESGNRKWTEELYRKATR